MDVAEPAPTDAPLQPGAPAPSTVSPPISPSITPPTRPAARHSASGALFPIGWSVFLLVATALTVFRTGSPAGLPVATARTPARDLFSVMAIGICIIWPMVRLSQRGPATGRTRAAMAAGDCAVVVAPVATVVLASQYVVGWGWERAGAVALMLSAWASLVGACIAIAWASRSGVARGVWMAAIAVAALVGPTPIALGARPSPDGRRALLLASPATGVYTLTATRSGAATPIGWPDWLAAAAPLVLSLPLWRLARSRP